MTNNFTPEETREFARLLRKIAENDYYLPGEAFEAFHGIASMWAPELIITRREENGETEILLAMYHGGAAMFEGNWHIPGGYNKFDEPDIQATCTRIAKRELGIDVSYKKIIGAYKWREGEHPYGRPLSLYAACDPKEEIKETDSLKFFNAENLPDAIIPNQKRFIVKHITE